MSNWRANAGTASAESTKRCMHSKATNAIPMSNGLVIPLPLAEDMSRLPRTSRGTRRPERVGSDQKGGVQQKQRR
jgi:hypothetical protein